MTAPTEAGKEQVPAPAEPRPQDPADPMAPGPSDEQAAAGTPADDDYEPL